MAVKWNSLERVVLNSPGIGEQTVNDCFTCFLFLLHAGTFTHLLPLPEVDKGTYVKSKEVQREGVYIHR